MNSSAKAGTKLRVVNIGCEKSYRTWSGEEFKRMHEKKVWLRKDYEKGNINIDISFEMPDSTWGYVACADDFDVYRKPIVVLEE